MTIDWTKPIELIDGTPLKLSETGFFNEGGNPDCDGDYWVEREDGLAFDLSLYKGYTKFCCRPDGYSGGELLVRNRTEQPVGIDWTKPIETVPCRFNPEPVEVTIVSRYNDGGDVRFATPIKACDDGRPVDTGPWSYHANGKVNNSFLPDLRNKVEPDRDEVEPEFDPAAWLEQGRKHADQLPDGVVLPEPPGFDYEPYREALQAFYDARELDIDVSTPFDSLDKRWADALIAAAKLLPVQP